jgi:hypothetical protein
MEAIELPDVLEAVRENIREGSRIYFEEQDIVRGTYAMAAIDADMRAAVDQLERNRLLAMRRLAQRLTAAGFLRGKLSEDDVLRLLVVLTSFGTFDLMLHLAGGLREGVAREWAALAETMLDLPRGALGASLS